LHQEKNYLEGTGDQLEYNPDEEKIPAALVIKE